MNIICTGCTSCKKTHGRGEPYTRERTYTTGRCQKIRGQRKDNFLSAHYFLGYKDRPTWCPKMDPKSSAYIYRQTRKFISTIYVGNDLDEQIEEEDTYL